jgi:hypothetical protein
MAIAWIEIKIAEDGKFACVWETSYANWGTHQGSQFNFFGQQTVWSASLCEPATALESVRRDHIGLHSFRSMSLMDARRRNARAF